MLGKRARPVRRTNSMLQLRPGPWAKTTDPPVQEQKCPSPALHTRFNQLSGYVPGFAPDGFMDGTTDGYQAVSNPIMLHQHVSPPVATHDIQHLQVVSSQRFGEPTSGRSSAYVAVSGGREEEFERYTAPCIDDDRNLSNTREEQQRQILLAASPVAVIKNRMQRSLSLIPPVNFLDACFYCHRPLGPGQDIYMYRGDTAFCSVECRQLQIAMDEKEKCSMVIAINKEIVTTTTHVSDHNNVVPRRTEAMA